MSVVGSIHLNIIHMLFDDELTAIELISVMSTIPGQMILPNLSAPERKEFTAPQGLSGDNPAGIYTGDGT